MVTKSLNGLCRKIGYKESSLSQRVIVIEKKNDRTEIVATKQTEQCELKPIKRYIMRYCIFELLSLDHHILSLRSIFFGAARLLFKKLYVSFVDV